MLLLRLRALLRRVPQPVTAAENDRPVRIGGYEFDPVRGVLTVLGGEPAPHLTGGEAALLTVLARRPGEVFSREELARVLEMDEAGERAIDVQVTRLRRKIEPDPREPRFLHTVRGRGYVREAGRVSRPGSRPGRCPRPARGPAPWIPRVRPLSGLGLGQSSRPFA